MHPNHSRQSSLELTGASLLGIVSQTSREQSAQSLYSPEDEVNELLRLDSAFMMVLMMPSCLL